MALLSKEQIATAKANKVEFVKFKDGAKVDVMLTNVDVMENDDGSVSEIKLKGLVLSNENHGSKLAHRLTFRNDAKAIAAIYNFLSPVFSDDELSVDSVDYSKLIHKKYSCKVKSGNEGAQFLNNWRYVGEASDAEKKVSELPF